MILSIWTNIGNKIGEFGNEIKEFFLENNRNPILWVGLFLIGLLIFELTYKALQKD